MAEIVTAKVKLDTRSKKKDGTHPVKIRVNSYELADWRMYDIPGIKSMTEKEFASVFLSTKVRQENRELHLRLKAFEQKGQEIAEGLDPFTFDRFKEKWKRPKAASVDVFSHFQSYIDKLKKGKQIGTAITYTDTLKSFKMFVEWQRGKEVKHLPFAFVNAVFLNEYEQWMVERGRGMTTISIYTRNLRSIFNRAIKEKDLHPDFYPFGLEEDGKYVIPGSEKRNKALEDDSLYKLYMQPVAVGSEQEEARDYWFGMYAANGMNLADLARRRYSDIQDYKITFYRHKTKRTTKRNPKLITIILTDEFLSLIAKYGNDPVTPDTLIFPIVNDEMTPTEQRRAIMNFSRYINQHIKKVAGRAGVTVDVSPVWSRHSRATKMLRDRIGTFANIADEYGHTTSRTSELHYWGGYTDEARKEISKRIMNFIPTNHEVAI